MPEKDFFLNRLSPEELAEYKNRFPILYFHMTSDRQTEQYMVLREMSSNHYGAGKSVAFRFYKPISKIR